MSSKNVTPQNEKQRLNLKIEYKNVNLPNNLNLEFATFFGVALKRLGQCKVSNAKF